MVSTDVFRRVLSSLSAPTLSTFHQGVAFEKLSLRLLEENLSMKLRHVGGSSDGGIDLQGWWWLPEVPHEPHAQTLPVPRGQEGRMRIRVLAQCKDERRKVSPKYMRELEGVLFRYVARSKKAELLPSGSSAASECADAAATPDEDAEQPADPFLADVRSPVVGVFISSSPFTKATLLRAHSSLFPLVLLCIPHVTPPSPAPVTTDTEPHEEDAEDEELDTTDSAIGSIMFNPALGSTWGLLRGHVLPRWERSLTALNAGRPGLWCNGQRLRGWTPETAQVG